MPAHARQDRVLRHAHVLENELARHARAEAHLVVDEARLEALRVGRDEEPADLAVDAADLGPDERDLGEVAVGDPALRPVEDVASRRRRSRRSRMPLGFEPKSGSVRPKQPMIFPLAISGRSFCLLLLRPERVDRVHDERALHARERAHAPSRRARAPASRGRSRPRSAPRSRSPAGCSRGGPARAISGMSSAGKVPFSQWSAMVGQDAGVDEGAHAVADRRAPRRSSGGRGRRSRAWARAWS